MKDRIFIGASVDLCLETGRKLHGEVTGFDDDVIELSHLVGYVPGVRVVVPISRILFVVFKD